MKAQDRPGCDMILYILIIQTYVFYRNFTTQFDLQRWPPPHCAISRHAGKVLLALSIFVSLVEEFDGIFSIDVTRTAPYCRRSNNLTNVRDVKLE